MAGSDDGGLSPENVYRALRDHRGWIVERDRVHRDLRLGSFAEALAVVNRVGEVAERLNRHPNIRLHEWCFVELEVYSHDRGGLSGRDVALVLAIDAALDGCAPT